MTLPARRLRITAPKSTVPAPRLFLFGCLVFFWFLLASSAQAQFSPEVPQVTRSVSGQFVVSAPMRFSWLFNRPEILANTNLVRLDPALLAVTVERFKVLVWGRVGLKPDSPWQGKIHLVLRPAESPEDEVTITSQLMSGVWDYQVLLPDVLTRERYARSMSAVLLLEIANRANRDVDHSAEIPAWLVDGLAQQVSDEDAAKLILSLPVSSPNGAPVSSLDEVEHGRDALASARNTLQDAAALTFAQLSWPTDEQLNGDDGGVYRASAELFVHELLRLPGGPDKARNLLARLAGCLNWQTAFFGVYHRDFSRPVEVEKWWSLRTIDFAALNASSQWTAADSNERLAALLTVPLQVRGASNSLPQHVEVSLQNAIRELTPEQRDVVLSSRLRDLELAQFRLARPFAILAAGYRDVLRNFLGESDARRSLGAVPHPSAPKRATAQATLKQLDALDTRRQELSNRLKFNAVPRT